MRPAVFGVEGHAGVSGRSSRALIPRFALWLAVVTAGGLLLRVLVVLFSTRESLSGDGWEYSMQATQMLHGKFFLNPVTGRPDAAHPPAWVAVLAAFIWLGGHTWLQQQLLACFIGSATVIMIGLAGRQIAGDGAGLIAAAIAAVYAGLWIYERPLLSETLLLFEIAVMVLMAYRFRVRPSLVLAALLGALCGILALTRSEQILILPLLVVPLILTAKDIGWRQRLRWLAVSSVSLLAVLTPWTTYNLIRFHHPVLLSTGYGTAAVQANCDAAYYGTYTGWSVFGCALFGSRSDNAAIADSQNRRIATTYAEQHLGRVPVVVAAREGRAFELWSPMQETVLQSEQRVDLLPSAAKLSHRPTDLWAGRLGLFSYWLLLAPAAAGAILLRRRLIPIYPLMALLVTVVIAVGTTAGDDRYRVAADVSILLLAAIAIDALLASRRSVVHSDPTDDRADPRTVSPRKQWDRV